MALKDSASILRSHLEDSHIHRPAHHVSAQIDGLERFLSLEPRSRILDLACGSGRQTIELARRGHRVLGVDPSEKGFLEARLAARAERLTVHFLKSDIRNSSYRAEFDAAIALSSSFGRFPSEREDLRALEAVLMSLKPGAKLLIDLLNKEWLMRHFEPNSWEQGSQGNGEVVFERVTFDFETGRLDSQRTLVAKDGAREKLSGSLRVYTLTELKSLLARAGLCYLRSWGAFDGSAYAMDSPRMIVLAARPLAARSVKRAREASLSTAIRIKGRRKR